MPLPRPLEPILERLESLVGSARLEVRERLLLESVLAAGAARAVALWRELGTAGWREVRARGPADALPSPAEVRAVLAGAIDGSLWSGVCVLRSGPLGLALGGTVDEAGEDLAQALLVAFACVDEAADPGRAAARSPAPLPMRRGDGDEPLGVLHDLGNLIAGIGATIEEGSDPAAAAVVERDCRRAGELISRALGRRSAAPPGCDPVRGAADAIVAESAAFRAQGIRLRTDLPGGGEGAPSVALDDAAFGRVVRNLLVNAREACAGEGCAGRSVRLRLVPSASPAGWILEVEDDGPGVEPSLTETLFEAGCTSRGSGRGRGLAIVRDLVEGAGGSVALSPTGRGGARFHLWLPEAPGRAPG